MILIIICFFILILILIWFGSYEVRTSIRYFFKMLPIVVSQHFKSLNQFIHKLDESASSEHTQQHWHMQQWWILLAGGALFSSILFFSYTRSVDPNKIEAEYLKAVDPQIYSLLNGEILMPPATLDDQIINSAIIEAQRIAPPVSDPSQMNTLSQLNQDDISDLYAKSNLNLVDRKWDKINPRYKQRLLMVFKIMKQRYGYDLVLLEGYRSAARQNMLSGQPQTTRARAYQSYHQFGLAADIAFLREGKVVISERDPWAMRGYQLYGPVAEEVGLTWGGRWKSIQDYGHTEYRMPGLVKTAEMARQLTEEGQAQSGY